jgi:TolB-like protein
VGPIREDNATPLSAGPGEPGAAEVRAALERVLASRCFEQAGRSSSFLRFVVEQTLAGQGERLKGYTIAVEVFGRPADFDAQSDPLVRVEAGRLRRRLIEYYADEGRDDPIRLELPRGSYSVVATYSGPGEDVAVPSAVDTPVENAAARNRRRWRRVRSTVVVGILAAGAAVILIQQREVARLVHETPTSATTAATGRPPLAILPFEVLGGEPAAREVAATLREELFLVLDQPSALVVPTETNTDAAPPATGYVLSGSVRESEGEVRITARVVRADTGAQIWSAAYDEPLGGLRSPIGQRRIARLLAVAAEPYGPVFDAELARMRALSAHAQPVGDCVLRYYDYRRQFGAAEYARAVECFELAVVRERNVAEAWAGVALLLADAWAHGFAGQGGSAPTLEKAREAARHAMDLDGGNLHANLALAAVQFFGGADFRDVLERVLTMWPENAEAHAYLGAFLILSGETARGSALVEQAIEWSPQVPSGYHASRALVALREQRYADALASALRIDSRDWAMGQVIVAAAGALAGRADLAERAWARLNEIEPTLVSSTPELLRRWRVEPVLAAELERGFEAAAPSR